MVAAIYAIATMDTKAEELGFVVERLRELSSLVKTVDVGTLAAPTREPDISRADILAGKLLTSGDRGQAITEMSESLADWLVREHDQGRVAAVIGLGGSGGTALITNAMRRLPVGVPKLMVSTMASGNTSGYVGCTDITMMYSVVDVAGLNVVSRTVLGNAAAAIHGMTNHRQSIDVQGGLTVGMTMFGVTTDCVNAARRLLEQQDLQTLVFHATGSGGRAMEKLIDSGMIQGVMDITTTEVADELVGGIMPAGADRFMAACRMRVPVVLSVGATDMVNFGAIDEVPEPFRKRLLYRHNAQVTLMRTTVEENQRIGAWIAERLNRYESPVTVVLPEAGVSALDNDGEVFCDPDARRALFDGLESDLHQDELRRVVRSHHHINAPEFATLLVSEFEQLANNC